jgi:hypothetical protein
MTNSVKVMTSCAVGGLVLVAGYSAALHANGWLWFAWVVLALTALGLLITDR